MTFKVLFDACVLLPYQLSDFILRLGETDIYQPLWSEEILEEVRRNLVNKFGRAGYQADRRLNQMRMAFPHAIVTGYEALIPVMTNDPKDRHVLAAGIRGQGALIVTANLKDFPPEALSPNGIEAVHPDAFLQDQLDLYPRQALKCLIEQRSAYTRPSMTRSEFYESLRVTVPGFADQAEVAEIGEGEPDIRGQPGHQGDQALPSALEIVSGEDAASAFFPDGEGPDPSTPLGTAVLWFAALLNRDEQQGALEKLSYNPADWNGYTDVASGLENWAIMQNVHYNEDELDDIAYVRFMPETGWNMRAFAPVPLPEVQILTLVRCPDGWWRAWGISTNHTFSQPYKAWY